MLTKKLCALVALCALSQMQIGCSDAHASPPVGEALAVGQAMPQLNSAGDHVYASAIVEDATGITTTVATAGTYVALASATLFDAGEADGSGCITVDSTSGAFTVAKRCGVGELVLEACINDVIGENNAVITSAWHRTRDSTTTLVGPIARRTEPATALRAGLGCVRVIVDAQEDDEYDFRYDSGTNADDLTTRYAYLSVSKILNK